MSASEETKEPLTDRADKALREFLRERDVACPVCDYNLRGFTGSCCPECRHALALSVCAVRPRLGWFLAAVAPGCFSGITAMLLFAGSAVAAVFDGPVPLLMLAITALCGCSGIFPILLVDLRVPFIAWPVRRQQRWAITIWLAHLAALAGLVILMVQMN